MNTFVNHNQSPSERRAKYALAREYGVTASKAMRYRDLTWPTLCQQLQLAGHTIKPATWRQYGSYMSAVLIKRLRKIYARR